MLHNNSQKIKVQYAEALNYGALIVHATADIHITPTVSYFEFSSHFVKD